MIRQRAMTYLACALLLAPHVVSDAGAQNSAETPYAATRLIGHWRSIMNTALEEGRAFAPEEVADLMEVFVSPGAVRAIQDKLNEAELKKADAIVERFALAVVGAGTRQPDGSVVVSSEAIAAAEKRVCPVYPFCS